MNCRIVVTPTFSRESKKLSKRYPSFADDFESFLLNLKEKPSLGTSIGHGIHKIRFAITSKGKGKRGGARVISHVNVVLELNQQEVTLLTIYDKSYKENITDQEIIQLLQEAGIE